MDVSEFEKLIIEYEKDIFHFCRHLTMEQDMAEELYQDTLLKAFEVCEKIKSSNNPKSFILSIAIGKWKNHRRKIGRRMELVHQQSLEGQETEVASGQVPLQKEVEQREDRKAVRLALMRVDEKFRIPLILLYREELKVEQIAVVLKIPPGTVKSRLYKGRELLKQELEKEGFAYE